jgi:hypothetical protein
MQGAARRAARALRLHAGAAHARAACGARRASGSAQPGSVRARTHLRLLDACSAERAVPRAACGSSSRSQATGRLRPPRTSSLVGTAAACRDLGARQGRVDAQLTGLEAAATADVHALCVAALTGTLGSCSLRAFRPEVSRRSRASERAACCVGRKAPRVASPRRALSLAAP